MEKYKRIKDGLTEIQFILDDLKDNIYQGESVDPVDIRIYDDIIREYYSLGHQVDELKIKVDGILLCKDAAERLDFFLKKIYKPEQYFNEDII